MKNIFLLANLLIAILFISCKQESNVIDNTDSSWDILIADNTQNPDLSAYKLPDLSIIKSEIMKSVNAITLQGEISKITEFRNLLYIFFKTTQKVIVIDKYSYELVAELDFKSYDLEPTDITFLPNATTAYVSHGNSNQISLIDITVHQIIRQITVGKSPRAITSAGNQIFVANYDDNTVSIIDSRTNKQEAVISVYPRPTLLAISPNGENVIIVSKGFGKDADDIDVEPTDAVVSVLDIQNRAITKDIPLTYSNILANQVKPIGMVITRSDWIFITAENFVFRIDAKLFQRIDIVLRMNMNSIIYNRNKRELLFTQIQGDITTLYTANERSGAIEKTFNLPGIFSHIHPL